MIHFPFGWQFHWHKHIQVIVNKHNSIRLSLNVGSVSTFMEVRKTVYFAYIPSILRHDLILWHSSPKLMYVFKYQKSIVRTICNVTTTKTSSKPLFRQLQNITLASLYIFQIFKFV